MPPKATKLLERMRRSKDGWRRRDLDRLYLGFGFTIKAGSSHDIVTHPEFPQLRAVLPRHNTLAKGYVEFAIKLVVELNKLKQQKEESTESEEAVNEQ